MLGILAVIIIHSAPFDEVAEGPKMPQKNKELSLKGGRTIVVNKIQFIGNKAISTKQLQQLTSPYLNRPISETDLTEIQERIERFYKSKGYDQVKVNIPSKQKGGVLTVDIEEGKKSGFGS
ncbi:MAG: Outer membrane protein assembly factor BamA [Chlamydiae bacterium]|nr:Outer membrane protein assembly factor BamA [Chlamydiota bacterium]